MKGTALHILLVEDDADHAEIVMRSMSSHRVGNTIHWVRDGEEALDYLFRRGLYANPADSPEPTLVLLDLRLPKVDGLEVLKRVKESPALRHIVVVILTTSAAERDVAAAYGTYANSYLVKPVDFAHFSELMASLGYYWLAWNRDPAEGAEKRL